MIRLEYNQHLKKKFNNNGYPNTHKGNIRYTQTLSNPPAVIVVSYSVQLGGSGMGYDYDWLWTKAEDIIIEIEELQSKWIVLNLNWIG